MSRSIGILKLGGNVHAIQCAVDILISRTDLSRGKRV